MTTYYTIRPTDVGALTIKAFGRVLMVSSFLGRVLPRDVGKRVYLIHGIAQVENDAQRAARAGGGGDA